MKKVSVIGSGSWGSTLALVLNDNKHDVTLYVRKKKQLYELTENHTNSEYLKDVLFPDDIHYTSDIKQAVTEADFIVTAVTTQATREVLQNIKPYLKKDSIVINVSKGLELGTNLLISQIYDEIIGNENYVVLSGPSHAEEVALKIPTAVVSASAVHENAEKVQRLFSNDYFRVYTNIDVKGVELGGAIKNIIALGCGISDAVGYGDNTRAAIITRGMAEISRFGKFTGANPLTFLGLSGIGDLIATCNSKYSRNKAAGMYIAKGYSIEQIKNKIHMAVEGIPTTKAVYEAAHKHGISMPITDAIYGVIYERHDIKICVQKLMQRDMKLE